MRSSISAMACTLSGFSRYKRIDRAQVRDRREVTVCCCGAAVTGSVHVTVQAMWSSGGSMLPSQSSMAGSAWARGVAPAGRGESGTELDAEAMRKPDAGRRGVDDSGLGREVAGGVGGNRAGDAIVVALHGLIDALGERQVGDGVVGIAQRIGLGVERRLLRRRCGRQTGDAPWIGVLCRSW